MRRRTNCRTLIQAAVVCCLATTWLSPVVAQSNTDEERPCWGLTAQRKVALKKKWKVKESRWSDLFLTAESLLRSGRQLDKAVDLLLLVQSEVKDPDLQAENYRGDVVFEYLPYFQLARAFLARNGPGDLECAQEAVRQATISGQAQQSGDKATRQEFDEIEARLRESRAREVLASVSQEVETWNRAPGHFSSPAGVAPLQKVRDFLSRGDPAQATAWEAAIHDLAKEELEYGDGILRQLGSEPWNQVFTPKPSTACILQDREITASWKQVANCQTVVIKELRVALKSACDSLGDRSLKAASELAALQLFEGVADSVRSVPTDCKAPWTGTNGSDLVASMERFRLSEEIAGFDTQIAGWAGQRRQHEKARKNDLKQARDLIPAGLPDTCRSEVFQATAIFNEFSSLDVGFQDALEDRTPLHGAPSNAPVLVMDQHRKLQASLLELSNKYRERMTKNCADPQTVKFQQIAGKLTEYRNTPHPTLLPDLCTRFDTMLGDYRKCMKGKAGNVLATLKAHHDVLSVAATWRPRSFQRPDCLKTIPDRLSALLVTEERAATDARWPERADRADAAASDCINQYRAAHSGWTAQVMSGFDAFPDIPDPDDVPKPIERILGPMRPDLQLARDARQGLGALLQWPEDSDAPQDLQQREEALSPAELQELDAGLRNIELTTSKHKEPLDRLEPTIAPWNAFRQALNLFDDGELDAAIGSLREAAEQEQHLEGNRKARYSHLRHLALAYFLFVKWSALDDAGGNLARRFESDARQEIAAAGASGEFPLPDELARNKDFEQFYKRSI